MAELLKLKLSRGGREEEEETKSMLGVPEFLLETQMTWMLEEFFYPDRSLHNNQMLGFFPSTSPY